MLEVFVECFTLTVFCKEVPLSSEGPDQMPFSVASGLELHSLHMPPTPHKSVCGQKMG